MTASEGPSPASRWPTLAHEWALIAFASVFVAVVTVAFSPLGLEEYGKSDEIMGQIAEGVCWSAAHVLWISMNIRRRRGRVGGWRYLVFIFGPFAVLVYLWKTFGLRTLVLFPLYLGIVAATVTQALLLSFVFRA